MNGFPSFDTEFVERLTAAVRIHAIGIFETNLLTGEVFWNREMQKIFGYEPGSFPGTIAAWREHLFPEDEMRLLRGFEHAIENKSESLNFTYRMHRRDGEVRHIEASVQMYYDKAGRHTRRVGVNVDVTDRVAEQARWRALFDHMHEGVVLCELLYAADGTPFDYRYLDANGRAEEIAGFSGVGRTAYEVHPNLEKFWLRKFADVVETGEPAEFTHFAAPLGRWFRVRAFRYAASHFAILFLNITEQRALEVQAQKAQRVLLKATRLGAMGAMASTIAHELNQPLGAAANYLATIPMIIDAGGDTGAIREAATSAAAAHLRAGEIIQRVKTFALEGRIATAPESLNEIIGAAATDALAEPVAEGVLLHLEVAADVIVVADRVQLEQVFSNLLRNSSSAMRAQKTPRQIRITAKGKRSIIEIVIEDSGPGISEDRLPLVFDAFHSTTAGMGLGLPICRTIIEAHGGRIEAVPSDGGAKFRIRLPKA